MSFSNFLSRLAKEPFMKGVSPKEEDVKKEKGKEKAKTPTPPTPSSKKKGPPPRWDEFMREKYEGGKKKVPNPNPNTRSRFQQVAISTALKFEQGNQKPVYEKLKKEYLQWLRDNSKNKSKSKKPSKPETKTSPVEKSESKSFLDFKHEDTRFSDRKVNTVIDFFTSAEYAQPSLYKLLGGKDASPEEKSNRAALLAGAAAWKDIDMQTRVYSSYIEMKGSGEHIEYYKRDISLKNGDIVLHNSSLKLKDSAPEGIGTRIFANQVIEAKRAGIDKIECYAYRDDFSGWIGYKVWPKMGYDGEIPDDISEKPAIRNILKEYYPDGPPSGESFMVSDLLSVPGGSAIWDTHGGSFDATFDLNNPRQLETLQKYLEKKSRENGKSVEDFLKMGSKKR